jgi:hypothetical protein
VGDLGRCLSKLQNLLVSDSPSTLNKSGGEAQILEKIKGQISGRFIKTKQMCDLNVK